MFSIERAKLEEIPEIKKLLKDEWVRTYSSFYSFDTIEEITSLWHDPKTLAKEIEDKNCYFATAKNEEGKIVGVVTARKITSQMLCIARLYVLSGFHKKGIGKRFIDNAINAFDDLTSALLEVEPMNKNAIGFYKKQGFVQSGETYQIIGGKKVMIIEMIKKLN